MSLTLTPEQRQTVHPLWLRLTHWLNALAMLIMVVVTFVNVVARTLFNHPFVGVTDAVLRAPYEGQREDRGVDEDLPRRRERARWLRRGRTRRPR